jgi:hypothetical protein
MEAQKLVWSRTNYQFYSETLTLALGPDIPEEICPQITTRTLPFRLLFHLLK